MIHLQSKIQENIYIVLSCEHNLIRQYQFCIFERGPEIRLHDIINRRIYGKFFYLKMNGKKSIHILIYLLINKFLSTCKLH